MIFGILILALPKLSLATLAVLIGLGFLVRGVVSVVQGIGLRRTASASAAAAAPPPWRPDARAGAGRVRSAAARAHA